MGKSGSDPTLHDLRRLQRAIQFRLEILPDFLHLSGDRIGSDRYFSLVGVS